LIIGLSEDADTARTCIGLARALAAHRRVVLADLALKAPRVSGLVAEPEAAGIADLMRGTASFGQIIARDRASRAHVIAAGQVQDDAAAVLGSERLSIAIDALGHSYDHVIVDVGVLPEITVERLARLGSYAVLTTGAAPEETVKAVHDDLIAAGCAEIAIFAGSPAGEDVEPAPAHAGAVAA
jgi:Mrp family chromosome partitioning ATPase